MEDRVKGTFSESPLRVTEALFLRSARDTVAQSLCVCSLWLL